MGFEGLEPSWGSGSQVFYSSTTDIVVPGVGHTESGLGQ